MRRLLSITVPDRETERVLQSHADAIVEIQDMPAMAIRVITAVLPNAKGIQIAHGLGRRPIGWFVSPPAFATTAGLIQDWYATTPAGAVNDESTHLSLIALGFGGDIRVKIMVL